jgi:hypothetical protein
MSELITVLNQLKKDFAEYDKLWEQAIECGNQVLADQIQEELITINNMINEIEKPEINRHLRLVGTQRWREFHEVR